MSVREALRERGAGTIILLLALAYVVVYLPQKWAGLHD